MVSSSMLFAPGLIDLLPLVISVYPWVGDIPQFEMVYSFLMSNARVPAAFFQRCLLFVFAGLGDLGHGVFLGPFSRLAWKLLFFLVP